MSHAIYIILFQAIATMPLSSISVVVVVVVVF